MSCENPNTSNRAIHLTSQQQASEAAYYYCMPDGNPDKGHVMTSVNTEGWVRTSGSSRRSRSSETCPKSVGIRTSPISAAASGPSSTSSRQLSIRERRDLGYTSPDFPKSGGPSSLQGPAANGVKVFLGSMKSYTNGKMQDGIRGVTTSDKAARYKHCVIDNGNGTLTTTIAAARPDSLADSRRQHSRRRHPCAVRRRQL